MGPPQLVRESSNTENPPRLPVQGEGKAVERAGQSRGPRGRQGRRERADPTRGAAGRQDSAGLGDTREPQTEEVGIRLGARSPAARREGPPRCPEAAGMRPTEGAPVQAVCVCVYMLSGPGAQLALETPSWEAGGQEPGSQGADAHRQGPGLGGSRAQGTPSLSKGQLWRVWGAKGGREVPLRPGSCSDSRRAAWEGSPGRPGRWHTAVFTYSI